MTLREREWERDREPETENTSSVHLWEDTKSESERARERESERARERESESASERERVRKREREAIVSLLWTRENERKSENPSSRVCGHDITESERELERKRTHRRSFRTCKQERENPILSREIGKTLGTDNKRTREGRARVSWTVPQSEQRREVSVVRTHSPCAGQPRGRPASPRRSVLGSIAFTRA